MSTYRPMRRSRKQEMYIAQRIPLKNTEGATYTDYAAPIPFIGEQWPASGKVQAEIYGERLPYIRNINIEGKYHIDRADGMTYYVFDFFSVCENDGVYIDAPFTGKPDYKIISIKPWKPLRLEVAKI